MSLGTRTLPDRPPGAAVAAQRETYPVDLILVSAVTNRAKRLMPGSGEAGFAGADGSRKGAA